MVDGKQGRAASDSQIKPGQSTPTFELDKTTLAVISADAFGKPGKHTDISPSSNGAEQFPLKLAQAVGVQGTDGAPAMPGTDVVTRPKSTDTPADKPYSISGNDSPAKPFVPIDYDIDKKVGGSSYDNYPDYVARMAGTAIGARMAYKEWSPEINKPLRYVVPPFQQANGVSAHTVDEFSLKRGPAHNFLKIEAGRLQRLTRGFNPDPDLRTDPENLLVNRVMNVKALKEQTTDAIREGNNPLQRVDFSSLTDDTKMQKGFKWVSEFETAQSDLIKERAESVKKWRTEATETHQAEVGTAKWGLAKDLGVLAISQVADYGIDTVAPRNRISWETAVVDFAAPILMMTSRMPAAGKFAPLLKIGIIVGAHAISHFGFDKQYNESGE